ncbi:unnamed protein product, partial [Musa textilis]
MQECFSIICKEPMSILIHPEQEACEKVHASSSEANLVIDPVSVIPPFGII